MTQNEIFNIENKQRNECQFKRHFIANVFSRVEYENLDKEKLFKFKNNLGEELTKIGFINSSEIYRRGIRYDFSPKGESLINSSFIVGLEYSDTTKTKSLQLIDNSILLKDNHYEGFEGFYQLFESINNIIYKILKIEKVTFIGLKKENLISIQDLSNFNEIFDYFNILAESSLNRDFLKEKEYLKFFDQSFIIEKNETKIIIKNSLTETENGKYAILIDLDTINTNKYDKNSMLEKLKELNNFHYDFFLWTIGNKLKEILEREENTCGA